jgi:hypothetical protein
VRFDQTTAKCFVFTYKEGLLSRVGHDLKLRCDRFEVTIAPDRVDASFDAAAFSVVGALKDGRESPGALSPKDERQILENMRRDVLQPDRFPTIRFTSDEVRADARTTTVSGRLELHGVSRPVRATARRVGGELIAEIDIHTPDFGIPPFSALLGALKVKPTVKVRLAVSAG